MEAACRRVPLAAQRRPARSYAAEDSANALTMSCRLSCFPSLLRTDSKRPSLTSRLAPGADVPCGRQLLSHWIRLRIDLAVSTASWAGVWNEVQSNHALRQLSGEDLEVEFLASARERSEMIFEGSATKIARSTGTASEKRSGRRAR